MGSRLPSNHGQIDISESQSTFVENTDVLQHIFEYLELRDILNVRKASKHLYFASKFRSIWEGLINDFMQSLPRTFYLSKPLHEHTSEELEVQLRSWYKSRFTNWQGSRGPQASSLQIPSHTTGSMDFTILLEGGRWILSNTRSSVVYVDRNDPDCTPHTLISEYSGYNSHTRISMPVALKTIEYLPSDTLRFNLAVARDREWPDSTIRATMQRGPVLEVWQVTQVSYESGGLGLQAECLSSFKEERSVEVDMCSLCGTFIAYYAQEERNFNLVPFVVVVDWSTTGKEQSKTFRRRYINDDSITHISLLPNHRLLAPSYRDIITVISWKDIPEVDNLAGQHTTPPPQSVRRFECRIGFDYCFLSRAYHFPDSTRFVMRNRRYSLGLVIPLNTEDANDHSALDLIQIPLGSRVPVPDPHHIWFSDCTYEKVALCSVAAPNVFFLRWTWPPNVLDKAAADEAQWDELVPLFHEDGVEDQDWRCNALHFDEAASDVLVIVSSNQEPWREIVKLYRF